MRDSRASIQPVNWMRPAIILALLFASAGLAYLDPPGKLSLILLSLGPAMLGLLLYLRRPALGVLALVFAAMMVPLSVGTGTGTSLNPVILMVPLMTGIWLLTMALRHRAIRIHRHSSIYFLLALNITVILALIVGRLSWFDIPGAGTAAQLGGVMVFFVSSAAFLLAAHLLDERWLARLVYMFIFIGASIVVLQFVPSMRSSITRFVTIGAMGSVFWIWLVTLAAGLALFHTSLTIHSRLLLAAVAAVTLLFGFMRNGEWASGWAPPLVALLLLVWLKYPRWGWAFLFIATLVFFFEFDHFWTLATSNESWLARRQAWQIVLDTASANPLLGLGPSNYYFYVQQATIMGWGGAWSVKFSSHNNWVDLIAQVGIVGTFLFVAFSASLARAGWRLYRRLPNGFGRGYAAACIAGLIATLISGLLGDWFLPFVYNIGLEGMRASVLFWLFLGGLLSLYKAQGISGTT